MTRFVIGPDVALYLAQSQAVVPAQHQLLAPTLIRSQVWPSSTAWSDAASSTEKPPNASSTTYVAFGCASWATECCKASPGNSPTNSAGLIPSWPNTLP